ncbi:TPA: hypothetical protein ACH3X1_001087 [Trebouxia sp. C0004]
MALFGPRFDLEAGEPVAAAWNGSMQPGPPPVLRHRAQASQRFIVGVVILLFLAGLVPFSSLLFLLLALFALASCIQYNAIVRQEADQRSNSESALQTQNQRINESFHHAAVLSMMGTLGLNSPALNNLRLAMLNRDFDDSDYEMLLQLDQPGDQGPQQSTASEAQLASVPSFTYQVDQKAPSDDSGDGNKNVCSVCLDSFSHGDQLSILPCSHKFHTKCIQPWLRQSGLRSQCPLCKLLVFDDT